MPGSGSQVQRSNTDLSFIYMTPCKQEPGLDVLINEILCPMCYKRCASSLLSYRIPLTYSAPLTQLFFWGVGLKRDAADGSLVPASLCSFSPVSLCSGHISTICLKRELPEGWHGLLCCWCTTNESCLTQAIEKPSDMTICPANAHGPRYAHCRRNL